jgi:hypothetical protein
MTGPLNWHQLVFLAHFQRNDSGQGNVDGIGFRPVFFDDQLLGDQADDFGTADDPFPHQVLAQLDRVAFVLDNGLFELFFGQQPPIDKHFTEFFLFFHAFSSINIFYLKKDR